MLCFHITVGSSEGLFAGKSRQAEERRDGIVKAWPAVLVLLAVVAVFAIFLLAKDRGAVVIVPFGWKQFDVAAILLAAAAVVVPQSPSG